MYKKITGHAKKQENTPYEEEKNHSIKTNLKLALVLEFAEKFIEIIAITIFHIF